MAVNKENIGKISNKKVKKEFLTRKTEVIKNKPKTNYQQLVELIREKPIYITRPEEDII